MQIRKIGDWREERVSSGPDNGFYVEAVDVARDRPRYAKVSFREIEDADIQRLDEGHTVEFPLARADLAWQWDQA